MDILNPESNVDDSIHDTNPQQQQRRFLSKNFNSVPTTDAVENIEEKAVSNIDIGNAHSYEHRPA